MQEIIALITQKTGISEQQAQTAVDTVVGYLKQKLPGPLAAQLDSVVAGSMPNLGDFAGGLGGLFGKK